MRTKERIKKYLFQCPRLRTGLKAVQGHAGQHLLTKRTRPLPLDTGTPARQYRLPLLRQRVAGRQYRQSQVCLQQRADDASRHSALSIDRTGLLPGRSAGHSPWLLRLLLHRSQNRTRRNHQTIEERRCLVHSCHVARFYRALPCRPRQNLPERLQRKPGLCLATRTRRPRPVQHRLL